MIWCCSTMSCSRHIFQQNRPFKDKAWGLPNYLNHYVCIQWIQRLLVSNIHVSISAHIYTQTHTYIYMHENIFFQEHTRGTHIRRVRKRQMQKDVEGDHHKSDSIIQCISTTWIVRRLVWYLTKWGRRRHYYQLPFSRWARGHTQCFCQVKFAMEILCWLG